jgi:hypothetical protein
MPSPFGRVSVAGGLFLSLAAVLSLLAGTPVPAASQGTGPFEARFDALRDQYDLALALSQQDRFNTQQALLRVTDARSSGSSEGLAEALRTYHALAIQEMTAGAEVRAIADDLRVAAEEMIDVLLVREDQILDDLSRPAPATGETLRLELQRVNMKIREADEILDRIGGGLGENLDLRPVLQIERDARDTPDLLRLKASVLEEEAGTYEQIIASTDSIIAELERREREERTRADLLADLNRFDQNTPLVVGGRTARVPQGSVPAGANDNGDLAQYTLAEQIEHLRGVRALAEEYRVLSLDRAREFRVAAGDLPG